MNVGKDFLREVRIAPPGIDFSMGYWLFADKAAFLSSRKESFGFIIESKELVEMLKVQFEVLWEMSARITGDQEAGEQFLKEI